MKNFSGVHFDESAKRRWRRIFKRRRRKAIQLGQQADEKIENLLIRRLERLVSVKRFIAIWVSLFVILIFAAAIQFRGLSAYYQELRPVAGGIYNEGTIGRFSNANPIYTTGLTDLAVSRLVFSGLLKYDDDNNLIGDLAEKWELNAAQNRYTVHLKRDIKWHDGQKFNADDVIFTYKTIQNSEAQSPFFTTWRGIKVTKQNDHTVLFDLPNTLSSFPHALTNGIVPAHVLERIPPSQLRSAEFNSKPVGTGPFEWRFVSVSGSTIENRQQRINLSAYKHYWAGKPKLDSISIVTFNNETQVIDAFRKKQLNAIGGLNAIPADFFQDENIQVHATPLTGAVMAFFNNSQPKLASVNVRKALVSGTDTKRVGSILPYAVKMIDSPLLPSHLGYDPAITQLPYDLNLANQLLDAEGWVRGADGIRAKDGQALTFRLRSQSTQEYIRVAQFLQKQWQTLGVRVIPDYLSSEDLQRDAVSGHDYDILLYGVSIGADPDVFAYWHSSQANVTSSGHLNLSEFKSALADQSLEAARTRSDPAIRISKYKGFLSVWQQNAPALALYQPNFLYVTNGPVFGYERKSYNSGADRFYNVHNWMVRQERQTVKK